MAERRMFSNSIVKSASFLKMPSETQCLYFHLCLSADDDGVVEAFTIMRLTGATEDSLKLLAAKKFVYVLNDDLVSFISDWREHNKIRADRKVDSIYKHLLLKVVPEVELLDGRERADRKHMDDNGTSHGQHSIGKDSIVEVSIGKDSEVKKSKVFSFALNRATTFTSLSEQYIQKLLGYSVLKDGAFKHDEFMDFHVAKGSKFKDWSAAYRTWIKRSKEYDKDYKPEKYIQELPAHQKYGVLYAEYGTNRAYDTNYDYVTDFTVKTEREEVKVSEDKPRDVKGLLGGLI